jgi:HEAT repeat protein
MPDLDPDAQPPASTGPIVARKLPLDDQPLTFAELVASRGQLDPQDLVLRLRDGRPIVRANAALGLAALGHTGGDLVPFLRDGDPRVALAAAEALAHLGTAQRGYLAAIASALDGARPEVAATVQGMFAELVGKADAELVNVLDTGDEVAARAVVHACAHLGARGLHLLQAAARDGRARVRINAVRGIGQLGELEHGSSMAVLNGVERGDEVSDVRAAARAAIAALSVRVRAAVAARHKASEPPPPSVPELERRALTPAELDAAAKVAPLDELLRALEHPRLHARRNAVRVLALQGAAAASTARALAVLLRDPEDVVRLEVASALGKLGPGAIVAAPALVAALGDADPAVIAAAEAVLADLGPAAAPALAGGLDVPGELHGARIAALIGRLPDGPSVLRDALAGTSVDVRIHAALGLGALGKARAGAALLALSSAAAGGNARLRAAAAKAIAMIEPRPERAPPRIAVAGFDDRVLADPELAAAQKVLAAAGAVGLAAHLHDARAAVRANAARALGTLGAEALPAAGALAVCLRDDAAEVRVAAAQAIDRIGDAAVIASAHDLVRALRGADPALAAQLAATLRARAHAAIDDALGRGLDTDDARHAERICELLCARPAALDLLCEAFARPPSQATAARGLVMLGKDRIGKGRALLESARASSAAQDRELARAALRELDGAPAVPEIPAVAGFETTLLEPSAFSDPGKLDAGVLLGFLQDGRAIVRANAATALGTLGPAAAALATALGALLRDDDARVRIAVAGALDRLGDAAVVAAAPHLVGALRGDAGVAAACRGVLAARKAQVEAALIAGLEAPDEVHGLRIAELICALPDARELLFIAFDSPAQNVQINAALGIGMLGASRAGAAGRRRLVSGLAGPFTRRREAMVKALAMLGPEPPG